MLRLRDKNILLIGGAGFIGRRLINSCLLSGMNVRVIDSCMTTDFIYDVEFVEGDYRNESLLEESMVDIDYIVHLAHDTILIDAACDMQAEIQRNILPIVKLFELCLKSSVSKLLFVSSGGTIYGNSAIEKPIEESSPARPLSQYGVAKLIIENIGFLYSLQNDLPFIVARPGNAYGEGQYPFRGQGFVPTALASSLLGKPLDVFGDGTVVRDYVHVQDIVDGLIAILLKGSIGEAYNIGTSVGVSLAELLNDFIFPIVERNDYSLQINYMAKRKVDVQYNVLSNEKLLKDTGFCPSVDLLTGLSNTWEWLQAQHAIGGKF